MGSEPAVSLEGVSKEYGTAVALEELSIAVNDGEFFTLVGPSGCGKTTTLRLIGGFEQPTTGTVRFDGDAVESVPPEDRDVGVVFQNYALFPHMTVGENVAYGLNFTAPPGNVSTDERVNELLELVDLAGFEDRDPTELSGGQQQRVAMARALAPGPSVLLLDEPMSALDAQLRERLRVQVREIQQELGITAIYVTHDQEEALAVSDRVAVMNNGRVEQIGDPETIYHEPASRFVAEFIGDNNVFQGVVRSVGDRLTVEVGSNMIEIDPGANTPAPGQKVVFCLRPEQFTLDHRANTIKATVESAEFLGNRTRVYLDWHGRSILARTAEPLEGTVTLGFDPADVHVIAVE